MCQLLVQGCAVGARGMLVCSMPARRLWDCACVTLEYPGSCLFSELGC